MRKIAVEEHVGLSELADIAKEENERLRFPNLNDPTRHAQVIDPLLSFSPQAHRLPLMEKCGLDIQVLSPGGSVIQKDEQTARAIQSARLANNKLCDIVRRYPERFRAMGALPMQDVPAALDEIDRCVALGFVGFMLHGPTNDHYYDEPQYEPVWDRLEKAGLPLYLHPANPRADQIRIYDGYAELLGHTWNWNVETATHALRLIFGGVFERHPDAMLMLGHMGEGLPFFLGRLDEGWEHRNTKALGRMSREPSYYLQRNVYVTSSGGWRPEAMHCAIEALGAEHVLFACDYPHYPLERSMQHMQDARLTPQQQELIFHGNAERIFKL